MKLGFTVQPQIQADSQNTNINTTPLFIKTKPGSSQGKLVLHIKPFKLMALSQIPVTSKKSGHGGECFEPQNIE